MDPRLPSVTVLVAARPEQAVVQAILAAKELEYPAGKLELLVVRGKQPSAQRNAGMRAARGELIYFLDDDSVPARTNLRRAVAHFVDERTQMVGGPNVCPPGAPWMERIFALVLGSWLAFGPSRARYTPIGTLRATSEKELILCNLVARRDTMLSLGGFNEALYPNEENALMDALQQGGGRLLYDPELVVERRPRASVRAFLRMLRTYGRGRAEQFRLHPTMGSALNFVPPFFLVYLGLSPFLAMVLGSWAFAPLGAYLFAVLAQAAVLVHRGGLAGAVAAIPFIIATHVLYGFGFWRGLCTRLRAGEQARPLPVEVQTVLSMKEERWPGKPNG